MSTSSNGSSRAGMYASIVLAVMAVGGSIVWVGTIGSQVTQNAATIQIDAELIRDQAKALQDQRVQIAQIETRMVEFGSQIHAQDEIMSLTRVDDLRFRGLIWPKVYGQPYPDQFYAPHVETGREIPAK